MELTVPRFCWPETGYVIIFDAWTSKLSDAQTIDLILILSTPTESTWSFVTLQFWTYLILMAPTVCTYHMIRCWSDPNFSYHSFSRLYVILFDGWIMLIQLFPIFHCCCSNSSYMIFFCAIILFWPFLIYTTPSVCTWYLPGFMILIWPHCVSRMYVILFDSCTVLTSFFPVLLLQAVSNTLWCLHNIIWPFLNVAVPTACMWSVLMPVYL